MEQQAPLIERELIVVTGKGGVGKTTVTAALALVAARAGRRTIAVEVSGQRRVPALLGHPAAGPPGVEEAIAPSLWACTADPERALAEWATQVVRPRALVELALRSRAFAAFAAAAPGARELVTVTKAWELTSQRRWTRGAKPYDTVVLDAPASGHGLALLRTPRTYSEIARMGPVATQARAVERALEDPLRTAVVAVATLEETPVNETLELQATLLRELGHGPQAIIANGKLRSGLSAAELKDLDGRVPAAVAGALRSRLERARLNDAQLRRLRRGAKAPVITLPFLGAETIGPGAISQLAHELAERLP